MSTVYIHAQVSKARVIGQLGGTQVVLLVVFFVLCGLGSFDPCGYQWSLVPEGFVCLEQALPSCGVENAV